MQSGENIQKHLKIHGRVQGVGFRYFTTKNAKETGVRGWVKNMPDGTVEVFLSGNKLQVKRMKKLLHSGPISAHVTNVEELPVEGQIEAFYDFSVRH
jgi:acylphosphatase